MLFVWCRGIGMHHHSISIARLTTALLASGVLACSLVDDEPPGVDTDDVDGVPEACHAQYELAQAKCLPGMQFESMVDGAGGSVILVDDPGAAVGVGPDAWLVQVSTEADYIASYQFDGATCTVGCGWCDTGESMCHQGFNENGYPVGCFMCLPYGTPDVGAQCADFMAACVGLDETGANDDGADETGADTEAMEVADADTFDCRDWDLDEAVVVDERGGVSIDAAIVELAAAHLGEPLAKCDGTRFRRRSDGYFEVSALVGDGLLARIGLEQGDVILELDDEPMRETDLVVSKAMDLFMGARPASKLTLVVSRGGKAITKAIQIR